MLDTLKQLNSARKLAKEMEQRMSDNFVTVTHGCIEIYGNLKKVISVKYTSDDMKKREEDLVKAFNKYIEKAEDDKKRLMMESMGGVGGMMDMLKGK